MHKYEYIWNHTQTHIHIVGVQDVSWEHCSPVSALISSCRFKSAICPCQTHRHTEMWEQPTDKFHSPACATNVPASLRTFWSNIRILHVQLVDWKLWMLIEFCWLVPSLKLIPHFLLLKELLLELFFCLIQQRFMWQPPQATSHIALCCEVPRPYPVLSGSLWLLV